MAKKKAISVKLGKMFAARKYTPMSTLDKSRTLGGDHLGNVSNYPGWWVRRLSKD